jgi:hypothetical protein
MAQTSTREGSDHSQTDRAEKVVDDVTHQVDDWSDKVADWVARAAARTREEVEDMWAEAQHIRRGR